ncbi:MAG: ATP-binding cassette domain-containing protein [Rhodospirillaceae bacterium]|nr:ATP-binding cassette domain-containing protein [Rhodospirillaceae bacterium]
MTAVRLSAISKIYGPKPEQVWPLLAAGLKKAEILARTGHAVALHEVSLDINPGELFFIMGRSGSGKSTLLRMINRLIEPTTGDVLLDGDSVCTMGATALTQLRKTRVSMVFQHFGLLPHKSVLENVAFPLNLQGTTRSQSNERAAAWLARVGLSGYEKMKPTALSSGMQQRVGLARALITEAPLLLMDEPFAALDPVTRLEMQDEVSRLQAELKKTIILVSHDPVEAARMAQRMAILHEGRLAQIGTYAALTASPANSEVAAFVRGFKPGT